MTGIAQMLQRPLKPPREKLTVSLAADDLALIDEIKLLTGAYTSSEVVRNALRQAAQIARERGASNERTDKF